MDQEAAIRALHHARNLNRSAKEAKARADQVTAESVVAAFESGLGTTRIASESGVSESKIRAIRDKNDIPPDPRYAHLRPPVHVKSAADA